HLCGQPHAPAYPGRTIPHDRVGHAVGDRDILRGGFEIDSGRDRLNGAVGRNSQSALHDPPINDGLSDALWRIPPHRLWMAEYAGRRVRDIQLACLPRACRSGLYIPWLRVAYIRSCAIGMSGRFAMAYTFACFISYKRPPKRNERPDIVITRPTRPHIWIQFSRAFKEQLDQFLNTNVISFRDEDIPPGAGYPAALSQNLCRSMCMVALVVPQ